MFDKKDLYQAYKALSDYLTITPLVPSSMSIDNQQVYLKLETSQATKSFKLRGALYRMLCLSDDEKKQGVITVSSGNHGIAVAYAAKLLNINQAIIIVPENTPDSKCQKIEKYGGTLLRMGANYDQAHTQGMEYIADHHYIYIDSYDEDPLVYYGQASVAMEIFEQLPEIDTILAPIGGGGLITGIAAACKALKPSVKVIGVQTESCPAYKASIDDQVCYGEFPSNESLCEALVGGIGKLAFANRYLVDDVIIVTEEEIKEGIRYMILKEKIVAEPSSCVVVAAYLHHHKKITGKNIALVISGSNIDENLILESLEK